jgi:hypothetical protein
MEKITTNEFQQSLQDVRMSYRLLAIYQRRILDTIGYVFNQFNTSETSWHNSFCNTSRSNGKVRLDQWSWDWLSMYYASFKSRPIDIDGQLYYLQIFHIADTGYFEAHQNTNIVRTQIEEFKPAAQSETRLVLFFSKEDGDPNIKILINHINNLQLNQPFTMDAWLAMPFNLLSFFDETNAKQTIERFKQECRNYFKIELK